MSGLLESRPLILFRKVNFRMDRKVICGIYCIFNKVNHKRYIGQSVDIEKRWKQHKNLLSSRKFQIENQHLVSAWHKYGADNFEFFIIEKCNVKELDVFEKFWIDYYNSNNPNKGYNKTLGGGQYTNAFEYNKERKGHILSEQDILKILKLFNDKESNTNIAKKFNVSKTLIASIRNRKSWVYLTDGLNIEYSNFYDTHEFTNGMAKPIDMYTLDGVLIKSFSSINKASKELNLSYSSISNVCLGKNVTAGNHIFRFHNDSFNLFRIEKKRDPKSIPIDQYDFEWNYIRSFNSINEAYIITGINGIQQALSHPELTRGSCHWLRKGKQPPNIKLHKMKHWVAVDQYDLDWNLIATYPSIKLASDATHIKADNIWRVIYGKRKTTGNYYWCKHEE